MIHTEEELWRFLIKIGVKKIKLEGRKYLFLIDRSFFPPNSVDQVEEPMALFWVVKHGLEKRRPGGIVQLGAQAGENDPRLKDKLVLAFNRGGGIFLTRYQTTRDLKKDKKILSRLLEIDNFENDFWEIINRVDFHDAKIPRHLDGSETIYKQSYNPDIVNPKSKKLWRSGKMEWGLWVNAQFKSDYKLSPAKRKFSSLPDASRKLFKNYDFECDPNWTPAQALWVVKKYSGKNGENKGKTGSDTIK